jgi:NAD+ synthase (glutamine-hydrolysing)
MSPKVAIAQINSTVGDIEGNRLRIADFSRRAATSGADIVLTPELSLTGYPLEDLLLDRRLYEETATALSALATSLSDIKGLHVLVGHHLVIDDRRYNACSILSEGKILDTYCKQTLFEHSIFDERRYFSAGARTVVFSVKGVRFGINIGEDAWFPEAPSLASKAGADVLLVLNASPYKMNTLSGRHDILRKNVSGQGMAAIYANLTGGQDELVFDGNSFTMNRHGILCARLRHCSEDLEVIHIDKKELQPARMEKDITTTEEVYRALILGTRDYVEKNGFPGAIVGLSGGVDSALTLAIAVDARG